SADLFPLFLLCSRDRVQRDEPFRRLRLFQHMLAIELGHAGVFGGLLQLLVTTPDLLLAGVLGDALFVEIMLQACRYRLWVENERMLRAGQVHLLAAREDLVPAVLFVPLGERGRHVHLLDNIAPTDTCVVSAEGDLAFLRSVGNDALLGAAEVVV